MSKTIVAGTARALALSAAVFVFAAAATSVSAEEAGLTGNVRDSFVGAASRSCAAKQTGATENASIPQAALISYCGCYANGLADRLSTKDLLPLLGLSAADRVAKMKPLLDVVVPFCVKEVARQMQTAGK